MPRSLAARQLPGRRTKIVATIGPATESTAMLRRMIAAGMDVARINFSHGTRAGHRGVIERLRRLAREAGAPLAILQDLQGPKIRVGRLPHPVHLAQGAEVTLTPTATAGDARRIPVALPGLARIARRGQRILLRDGTIELVVVRRRGNDVHCRVVRGGTLGEHQGVNLPGVRLRGAALTSKDIADLRAGLRYGVDYVALSFVRGPADLRHARRLLRRWGRSVPIVAKLERPEAIEHLEEIVAASDAVMVARGDLGVELPPEEVPLLQKRIIRVANAHGVPVITATQMLESMVHQQRPTRAETSDVANAILDGTDAVMLSAETAVGRFPIEAVQVMDRIARATEAAGRAGRDGAPPRTVLQAIGSATQGLADQLGVRLIVAVTSSGRTACALAQLRPAAPVLACTEDERVATRLTLYRGVWPIVLPFERTADAMVRALDRELVRRHLARPADPVVLVGSVPLVARGRTNFVQYHRVLGPRGGGME